MTLEDFLGVLQVQIKKDFGKQKAKTILSMTRYNKEWICQPGMNTLTPQWNPKDNTNKSAKMTILQDTCLQAHSTLRTHVL